MPVMESLEVPVLSVALQAVSGYSLAKYVKTHVVVKTQV
jgi:hypothetical protein